MEKKLEKAMNDQIRKEFYSAYLYLSMSAYFEEKGLAGFSHWMQIQAQEEMLHGMKFFEFLNDRGSRVILPIPSIVEGHNSCLLFTLHPLKHHLKHRRRLQPTVNRELGTKIHPCFYSWPSPPLPRRLVPL